MKPLTLTPEEIHQLPRVTIWREMEEQPVGELCPCIGDGEWHDRSSGFTVFEPYQPGAEFWVYEKTYPLSTESTTYQVLLCDARTTPYTVRVISVRPEKRDVLGWAVELEVV